MSDYTKTTNFATKDALVSGDPLKIVKGTELDLEFTNIQTAGLTKANIASPTFTGTVTIPTLAGPIAITGALNEAQGADIASAGTINLDTATGNLIDVTGTVAITAITLSQGRKRFVRFTGALTLTNGASLVLPGAANITTVAGDCAIFAGYAAGVVRCLNYIRATTYLKQPTRQTFLSGSGTYTTPTGATRIFVRAIGGGTGGAGSGSAPAAVSAAGDTTFSTVTATKGGIPAAAVGGTGGTPTGGDINIQGGHGATAGTVNTSWGGYGGASVFGGAGPAGGPGIAPTQAAATNTGSGGGGGGQNATASAGGGGAAGGYAEKTFTNPAATYSYAVGAGSAGGTAGGGGAAGAAGAAGIIIVDEFYN